MSFTYKHLHTVFYVIFDVTTLNVSMNKEKRRTYNLQFLALCINYIEQAFSL